MAVSIERAAVIGAGVMGSALAAHLANAGIPTLLLDIVPPDGSDDSSSRADRNAFAARGLKAALKSSPASFFTQSRSRLVTVGNLEDDLDKLGDVDLVLEAIVEKIEIKQDLFSRIAPHLKPDAVIATNTSGLSVEAMAAGLPDELRGRFVGMHFFNPPRYLHLLEIIPHSATNPDVLRDVCEFGEVRLGKGVVVAKDTPSFIANRIGVFAVMSVIRAMIEGNYTVEEVDALTGPLIGRARSATFRTVDLVGLDILVHASMTVYDGVPDDEKRDYFKPPEIIERMLKENRLGQKTGLGFYKKVKGEDGSQILTLDLETFDYRERETPEFPSVDIARDLPGLANRIGAVLKSQDRAGEFLWKTLSEALIYAANRVGEVADDIVDIDNAMKWGFGWKLGPFEMWDALGVETIAARIKSDGGELPAVVEAVLKTEHKTFYRSDEKNQRLRFHGGEYAQVPVSERAINLATLKENGALIKKNSGASLIDIGDGVVCLEFHSKMNAIGEDIIGMIHHAVRTVEADFDALVVGNQGSNFSVGANLMLILLEAQDGNWEEIDLMVRQFQRGMMALKYCRRPVVAAPFGMTLGGGCEVVLGAGHACASAETYMGLVELGVGLIPAGGGCKELLVRSLAGKPNVEGLDPFPYARAAFETIALAKIATSAMEAQEFNLLRESDVVCMNPDHLLFRARAMARGLAARGYLPPDSTIEIEVSGQSGIAVFRAQLYNMSEGGFISEHDAYLAGQLAHVICGGEVPSGTKVSEQYLLDLEREVFLRVSGQPKSHARMQHMLKHGKPLRN